MRNILPILLLLMLPGMMLSKEKDIKGRISLNEERTEYTGLIPDSRVVVNAPAADFINFRKPVRLILFALPNGNSIEN
ncbi:MAG: hypothetical protein HGA52_03095, partial [Bacteroidales bacterium]|nr:hypothetical protein [Bacteroidales bacterium]